MGQKDRDARYALQRAADPVQIGMAVRVVDAADRERPAPDRVVHQHGDTGPAQCRRDLRAIIPMIMIAEHRDDAERGAQPGERRDRLLDRIKRADRFVVAQIIARQQDDVGMLALI